jgi:hypothetical protein
MVLLLAPVAGVSLAARCQAAPSTVFYPSASSAQLHFEPRLAARDIQILSDVPVGGAVILGELNIESADASLHSLVVAALGEAASRGADFVALINTSAGPGLALGKMVPVGHGRSRFVAAPVLGSEVNRIAAIPDLRLNSIRFVLGRYSGKDA